MPVISIDPVIDTRWGVLGTAPGAGLFHSPPWMAALRNAYGFEPRAYLAVDAAGAARGGVAFCEIDDLLGRRLVSLPFSDVCDPLLLEPGAWPSLRDRLAEHAAPLSLRCLDDSFLAGDPEFAVTKRARWHTLALDAPADLLRGRFGDTTRRALAKAERAGVVVRPLEGEGGLDGFVRLHARLRKRKYRMLSQPPAFFAAIAEQFRAIGGWYPLGAWHGDRLLAATVYLKWGDVLYYKFNASDPDGLALRPNNLLVWAGLELAVSLGCRALDLGPSDDNQPGLIRFKREFGAAERELRFLKRVLAGYAGEPGAELRPVLGEVTRLLTLPALADEVTAAAGASLYRYFA
jgi:CelD/BcsL family acetyltransferase involved in cellulose biosynthesis